MDDIGSIFGKKPLPFRQPTIPFIRAAQQADPDSLTNKSVFMGV
jgi:hypothetical protein